MLTTRLDEDQQRHVRALATEAEARDGQPPLSDQGLANLRREMLHVVQPDGYAQVDGPTAEVVAGDAKALLSAVVAAGAQTVWAHGERSPVVAAAESYGFVRIRELWQLRRELGESPLTLPDGVTLRAFVPGQDEDAWLAVNAAAFANHPEQGRWTRADLEDREAEEWFDPAGFLLAERDGTLLGFHWTKVHPGPPPIGEVYVLGVEPAAQGLHLGRALLAGGLQHLRRAALTDVLLYVDGDNAAAMALYERSGFVRYDRDVQYDLNSV